MDHTRTPVYRLVQFLRGARESDSVGCRGSGGEDFAHRLELRYKATPDGPESMIGLRAELRDGAPVIVLYDHSELAPNHTAVAS